MVTAIVCRKFNGVDIPIRNDNYLNATAMCKAGGKLLGNYLVLKGTQEFLAELASDIGIPISVLVQVRKGGLAADQDTYVHPDVAVDLAQWISRKFRAKVARWVRELLTEGTVSLAGVKPATLEEKGWSRRFDSLLPAHHAYISRTFPPGYWTVILETALPTLSLEDRLIAHGLGCKLTDLPDGSIGSCWAFYRKNVLKLAESHIEKVKVYSQTKGDYVDVKVYPSCEKEVFLAWLRNIYNPEKLPKYLREKMVRDEKPDHVIPAVSAAHRQSLEFSDLPARRLTGREKWAIRNAKDGFIKVGDELALPAPKRLALPASQTPDLFAGVP